MWIFDKLFNRKIEGKSSLDNLEQLAGKVGYEGDKVKVDADVEVKGLTSKGIANTGNLANIGDGAFTGTLSAKNVVEEGDTELIDLTSYINSGFQKSNTLYAKALVKHGMLHVVVSGNFVAKDISTATNRIILDNFLGALPEYIKDKIYRDDGTKISEGSGGAWKICSCVGARFHSSTQANQLYMLTSYNANTIGLEIRPMPSIADDTTVYIDARFALMI